MFHLQTTEGVGKRGRGAGVDVYYLQQKKINTCIAPVLRKSWPMNLNAQFGSNVVIASSTSSTVMAHFGELFHNQPLVILDGGFVSQ